MPTTSRLSATGMKESKARIDRRSIEISMSRSTTNDQEYYAELSEAYFGKNDFYPFTRRELEKHGRLPFNGRHMGKC